MAFLAGLILAISPNNTHAQSKYWYFVNTDIQKDSAAALLLKHGAIPILYSEWFHAWSARSFGQRIAGFDSLCRQTAIRVLSTAEPENLGFALAQIKAEAFIEAGLSGKGVKIGIIDGGFLGADKSGALEQMLRNGQLKEFRNFLNVTDQNPYTGTARLDDGHGTEVWELTGGNDHSKTIQFGMASGADYYLARTDHGGREARQEEDFLIAALEWLSSKEVRLVNVSLGYNINFDDPSENYTKEMMDGKTTMVSRACQRASEKGMLIVVAAGNDGNKSWQIVSAPADAPGVLTVGATDIKYWKKADYSSIGTAFGILKPEISCFASTGTSFSTPVITGLAACIWEKNPGLSATEVKSFILSSGHLAAAPNNFVGYGVPDAGWLFSRLMKGEEKTSLKKAQTVRKRRATDILLTGQGPYQVVLFHKKNQTEVLEQVHFTANASKISVKPAKGSHFTTVQVNHEFIMEIEWDK